MHRQGFPAAEHDLCHQRPHGYGLSAVAKGHRLPARSQWVCCWYAHRAARRPCNQTVWPMIRRRSLLAVPALLLARKADAASIKFGVNGPSDPWTSIDGRLERACRYGTIPKFAE